MRLAKQEWVPAFANVLQVVFTQRAQCYASKTSDTLAPNGFQSEVLHVTSGTITFTYFTRMYAVAAAAAVVRS